MENIYCYVDESGQDTQGQLFVVAVIISTAERRDSGERRLLEIETNTRKRSLKWKKTHYVTKANYLQAVATIAELRGSIFYSIRLNTRDYIGSTVDAIVRAIRQRVTGTYRVTVEIDGLNKKTAQRIARRLKQERVTHRKVRGLKDENSAWIRLADAIAGFSRDAYESKPYTQSLYPNMLQRGYLIQL